MRRSHYQIWINPGTLKYIFITSAENFSILTIQELRDDQQEGCRNFDLTQKKWKANPEEQRKI
jgi:hypothetical protein